MRNMVTLAAVVACWSWASLLPSDEIHMTVGGPLPCTVLQEDPSRVTVLFGASVLSLSPSTIEEIVRSDEPLAAEPAATSSGLPAYGEVMRRLARLPWAVGLRQIPATVIDVGVLRSVPYKSQRVAEDCEINVYGDPDSPAGVEVGLQGAYLNDAQSKTRCIEFMASLLPALRGNLLEMNREKSLLATGPLTLEVTPPSDADAYNAWWISAYNKGALERARASAAELAEVTEAHRAYLAAHPPVKAAAKFPPPAVQPGAVDQTWAADDFRYARPVAGVPRVYIRGYTRVGGYYVQPHVHVGGGHRR